MLDLPPAIVFYVCSVTVPGLWPSIHRQDDISQRVVPGVKALEDITHRHNSAINNLNLPYTSLDVCCNTSCLT